MFNSNTVFIVGAGASRELNFPIGSELLDQIADLLRFEVDRWGEVKEGDWELYDSFRIHAARVQSPPRNYLRAGARIRLAVPVARSIDNLLDAHQEDGPMVFAGKAAIAKAILQAEKNSALFAERFQEGLSLEPIKSTWYAAFARTLFENVTLANVDSVFNNVSFVTFNYDRCIENFLYYALRNYYSIRPERAAELVSKASIYHPYGSLGQLPWQTNTDPVAFGAELDANKLIESAERIRTFTERVEEHTDTLQKLREKIQEARTCVFLGFSFQHQNMELLQPQGPSRVRRVFATALGMSDDACNAIELRVYNHLRPEIVELGTHVNNKLTCAKLFDEYALNLTQ